MKKKLLLGAMLMGSMMTASAQTTIWSDNFDDENISDWTLIDADGDGDNFSVVQVTDEQGQSVGTPLLRSASWIAAGGANGTNLSPDNWAISPAIDLANASGEIILRWEAIASDADWDDEEYTVYVASGNTQAALEASSITFNESLVGVNALTPRTLDISSMSGQMVYVAFRHHNSTGQFTMGIDTVSVTTETLGVNDHISTQLSVFPNPATDMITITNADVLITGVSVVDLNGRTVKTLKFDNVSGVQINISDLASGVYMMNVTSNKGVVTKKVVKN